MFRVAERYLVPLTLSALPALCLAVVVAGLVQPACFDWVERSVSAMAALDAEHRYLTTAAMAGSGVVHLIAALGLTAAAVSGRVLLAAAGFFLLLAAGFPLPAGGAWSIAHAVFAGLAAVALAAWPAVAGRCHPFAAPAGPAVALVLFALLGWYLTEVAVGGALGGFAERAALTAEFVWLAVVVRAQARTRVPPAPLPPPIPLPLPLPLPLQTGTTMNVRTPAATAPERGR
ncbi:hypothetical protein Q0Z83_040310 [Actinoplanes sichuanensis]|uniref:DUF998 domain-containing protein n=1 Tax=Actinoplanes sichuanensis TaxID=512349 RepID=A0ABW4A4S9_9ACTN|nr:DUF998 domain-containing protein [Actinoplanes sichuanensis]BEL05840.1 hypothetical protein Q0Z83_040310 [Actinoplanes sichuanensis]